MQKENHYATLSVSDSWLLILWDIPFVFYFECLKVKTIVKFDELIANISVFAVIELWNLVCSCS